MNKLSPEHLHLLLDEPIYVLDGHFESHGQKPELEPEVEANTENLTDFRGDNMKGILILNENNSPNIIDAEDEAFLFKGLNALDIQLPDVAITNNTSTTKDIITMSHSKRINFSTKPVAGKLYQIVTQDDITYLECHSISQIRSDKELKVKFWLGLKTMFAK